LGKVLQFFGKPFGELVDLNDLGSDAEWNDLVEDRSEMIQVRMLLMYVPVRDVNVTDLPELQHAENVLLALSLDLEIVSDQKIVTSSRNHLNFSISFSTLIPIS
jgi:hypothetical protein